MEVWKDIKGYEKVYQVSNKGNVRRLTFTNNQVTKKKIHSITPTDNGNGYLIVGLRNGSKRRNFYVHRLVAEAFCEKASRGNVVNHIDHNRSNNTAENLEWCTQKQNIIYSSDRMKHEKSICKQTNTGEKYIRRIDNRYCVSIHKLKIYKSFKTLEEAVMFRNEVVKDGV